MEFNKWYDAHLPGQATGVDVQVLRLDETTLRVDLISQGGGSGDTLDKRATFDSSLALEEWVKGKIIVG